MNTDYMIATRKFKLIVRKRWQQQLLDQIFTDATHVYNYIVDNLDNKIGHPSSSKLKDITTRVYDYTNKSWNSANVEIHGPAVIARNAVKQVYNNLSTLQGSKAAGNKIGRLKFKRRLTAVLLTYQDYSIKRDKNGNWLPRIRIPGCRSRTFYFRGLKQIHQLEHEVEYWTNHYQQTVDQSYTPLPIKFKGAFLLRKADGYYIAISFAIDRTIWLHRIHNMRIGDVVGLDMGVKKSITFSNGIQLKYTPPQKLVDKIASINQRIAKSQRGSRNRLKRKWQLRRVYQKLANVVDDFRTRVFAIVNRYSTVCLQDEDIKGWMKKNRNGMSLGEKLQYVGLGMIKRRIVNQHPDCRLVDRFNPTSKTCSQCGNIKDDLQLGDRVYVCDKCGFEIDRDLNAAINMVKVATGVQPVHELSEIDAVRRTLKHCNVEMNIIDRGSRFSPATERLPVQSSGQEAVSKLCNS